MSRPCAPAGQYADARRHGQFGRATHLEATEVKQACCIRRPRRHGATSNGSPTAVLSALVIFALQVSLYAHASSSELAHVYVETHRSPWGPYVVTHELNANRDAVASYPFMKERYRILDARGTEFGEVSGQRLVDVSYADVDGDAVIDLVFTGNSGGLTGCCEFIEVWTIAGGEPRRALLLWGGRGMGDTFSLLDAAAGEAIPVRALQYLYVGDLPFCCLPSVPRAFAWDGEGFTDVTRATIPAVVGESLGESRATVRHLVRSQGAWDDSRLLAPAISAYAAAFVLGRDDADIELKSLRDLLPDSAFEQLDQLVGEIELAITEWIDRLDD
jgi:hypothetical protein